MCRRPFVEFPLMLTLRALEYPDLTGATTTFTSILRGWEVQSPGTNEFQQRLSFEPGPNFLHSGRPKRAGSAFDGSDLSVLFRDGGE